MEFGKNGHKTPKSRVRKDRQREHGRCIIEILGREEVSYCFGWYMEERSLGWSKSSLSRQKEWE